MFRLIEWSKIICRGPCTWLLYSIASDYGQLSIHALHILWVSDKSGVRKKDTIKIKMLA